jgi:cytochrome c oxidase assembly protein subunit 15
MLKNINYNTFIHIWLITLIVLVAFIIIVGGLTRLTDSGLSITEWELLRGILPPLSADDWIKYFNSYKEIPQYILLNSNMTIEEFKFIFLWEYAHRLLARFIGLFFLIPFIFLIFMKVLKKDIIIKLVSIFILILIQGSIGWYMVKSGLIENTTVSHYRLSIHLFIAFSILSSLVWLVLNNINKTKKKFFQLNFKNASLKFLLTFLFAQIILGAFVSGLDAGKIYQTWPLMNGSYLPNDIILNKHYNLNQASFVQFLHRNVAYIIFFLSIYVGFNIFKRKESKLYINFFVYFSLILLQIILGILVLVSGSNIYFASMHQISSIFLIIVVINLYYSSIRS